MGWWGDGGFSACGRVRGVGGTLSGFVPPVRLLRSVRVVSASLDRVADRPG